MGFFGVVGWSQNSHPGDVPMSNCTALCVSIGKNGQDVNFRFVESRNGVWMGSLPEQEHITTDYAEWFAFREDDRRMMHRPLGECRTPNLDPDTNEVVMVFDPTKVEHTANLCTLMMYYVERIAHKAGCSLEIIEH